MQRQSRHFPAELSNLSGIRKAAAEFIADDLSDIDKNRLIVSIDEAAANIILHGYENSSGEIILTMEKKPGVISLILDDTAPLYNPLLRGPADTETYYREGRTGGLGVDAYSRIAEVTWEQNSLGGNRLIFTKKAAS